MGYIHLDQMEFYAYHGVYKEERQKGNKFIVNLKVEVDFEQSANQDDLTKTVNYEELYTIVKEIMDKPSNLLEFLSNQIAQNIKSHFTSVKTVWVKVQKYDPPIGGPCNFAAAEVEI